MMAETSLYEYLDVYFRDKENGKKLEKFVLNCFSLNLELLEQLELIS